MKAKIGTFDNICISVVEIFSKGAQNFLHLLVTNFDSFHERGVKIPRSPPI